MSQVACQVCVEVQSGSMQASVFAAGFAGVAVGVKMSWQRFTARSGRADEADGDDRAAVAADG